MHTKRTTLKALTASAAALLMAPLAQAQTGKTIRFILPLAPGGGSDTIGRQVALEMGKTLGTTLIADNKPGASGTLALNEVVRASAGNPAMGLVLGSTLAVVPHLIKPLPYDSTKDVKPVAQLGTTPFVLLVNKDHPAKTLQEFVALAKARPQEQNFGSFGSGSSSHVVGEAFNMTAGTRLVHVPYRGTAPAINDLLGNQVVSVIADFGAAGQYLGPQGRLRALAVTGATRAKAFPEVATFGEQGYPAMNALVGWIALVTSKNTPDATVAAWATAAAAAVQTDAVQNRLITLGYVPSGLHGKAFETIVAEEPARWGKLIEAAQIRLES